MDEFIEMLEDLCPEVDFENEKALVDDKILSSFHILSIVSEINEMYGIRLTPAEVIPANFNSAENLWKLIQSMKK